MFHIAQQPTENSKLILFNQKQVEFIGLEKFN